MKILNLLTILGKKILYMFFLFETSKLWNCWPFYPTGTMSRMHTFEKRQCDRCRHRSAVKNTPPPPLHSQSPSLPPTVPTTPAPTAQGQWYRAFWIMWPPRPMAVAPLAPGAIRSVPRPPPPAQCRQNQLFGIAASGEKGLSLLEGLGKEYMTWRETSVGKTGTQAEGRHVVIRASQG